jgi:tryptophan synthase beta chain
MTATLDATVAGRFGDYGGAYVPETVVLALEELEREVRLAFADSGFLEELHAWLRDSAGRPTPLTYASRLTKTVGGAQIWLKREDLLHTGAHKINNAIGQVLLAKRMGKRRIIAETGAGQHGLATATVCAALGLDCIVYMGAEDIRRQALNVYKMRLMGAQLHEVTTGSQTLTDATAAAIRDWVANVRDTHYVIGSAIGPHPYPALVRDLQRVIGDETRAEGLKKWSGLPQLAVACVGGGSNAIGMFTAFIGDEDVQLLGVEAAGDGLTTGRSAASLSIGSPGTLHGTRTYLLQDAHGQMLATHSISAGLDYPGVGPEHAFLKDSGRVEYVAITDTECLDAVKRSCELEGILPALESSHAVAAAMKRAAEMEVGEVVVVCLSGRGDKDIETIRAHVSEIG